jgi:hypothetical protein
MASLGYRRVLMIGGEGVVLYMPSGKGVEREISISWEVPNFDEQLIEVLSAKNQEKSVIVLFDGADQAYRKEENIPKLSFIDRPRFVKRKLELAFPSYPIRAALEIKPQKAKGFGLTLSQSSSSAPPSYLFVALPETDQLDRIGDALFESGVPVAGVGALPVESADMVTEITEKLFGAQKAGRKNTKKKSRWSVLIGQHETGGLRQVVVKDGNLALARLTPTLDTGPSGHGWVEDVMHSFKETLAYISRFGYTQDDGLDVVIICGDVEKQFFDAQTLPITNFKCLNAREALALIGVRAAGLGSTNFADAVHAAWAGKRNALVLPIRIPSIHRAMAPRLGARLATSVLVLTGLGLAGFVATDYQSYLSAKGELSAKQNQQQMMQREYDEESKAFDVLPIKPEIIKSMLGIKKQLDNNTADPAPILARLKTVLGSDVTLKSLSFEHTPGVDLNFSGGVGRSPQSTAKEDKGLIALSFSFSLPDTVQLEQKVTRAEVLQKDLQKAFPSYRVDIVSQFGNISRTGQFQGETGPGQEQSGGGKDEARFKMEGRYD